MQDLFARLSDSIFSIDETLLVVLFISFTAVSLFLLCIFSFSLGKNRYQEHKLFRRWWYVLFILIGAFTVFLRISFLVVSMLVPRYKDFPYASHVVVLCLGITMLWFLFELRSKIHLPKGQKFYFYFQIFISFGNIFVFTALKMPLFILFGVEFVLVALSAFAKKLIPQIIVFLLMLVPFMLYARGASLQPDFTYASFLLLPADNWFSSFVHACIVLPFIFMAIRILISLKVWSRPNRGKNLRRFVIGSGSRTLVLLGISLISWGYMVAKGNALDREAGLNLVKSVDGSLSWTIKDGFEPWFNVKVRKQQTTALATNVLEFSSNMTIVSFDVSVSDSDYFPVLSSDCEYSMADSGTAVFSGVITPALSYVTNCRNCPVITIVAHTDKGKNDRPVLFELKDLEFED
ncbi:MAG: hypothetical protein MJ183_02495 [Treponemataceae bacterium]|nr:hypothetical protein [Treponemataceae bacterium]